MSAKISRRSSPNPRPPGLWRRYYFSGSVHLALRVQVNGVGHNKTDIGQHPAEYRVLSLKGHLILWEVELGETSKRLWLPIVICRAFQAASQVDKLRFSFRSGKILSQDRLPTNVPDQDHGKQFAWNGLFRALH
jgi:hypothetical protein